MSLEIFDHDRHVREDEPRAASIRARDHASPPPPLLGGLVRLFGDWAVTTAGLESLVAPSYDSSWNLVHVPHWEAHLRAKEGSVGSTQDALAALQFARTFFPVPPAYASVVPLERTAVHNGQMSTMERITGRLSHAAGLALIADVLQAAHLPYSRRPPLLAKDGTVLSPGPAMTFTWQGRTFYWEHLAVWDTAEEGEAWERRWEWYSVHGYARRLIITSAGAIHTDATLEEALWQRLDPEVA
jgi:hypothetical protein